MRYIYNKNGALSKGAVEIIKMIRSEAEGKKTVRLHLKEWSGYKSLKDALHYNTKAVLKEFGVPFSEGNDAPRGGVTGDFIEIKVDRRNRFWSMAI